MRREPGPVDAQQGSSSAVQLQLDSITSATASNASPPPRSAPLNKAEQEHRKRPRPWGGVGGRIGREGFSIANFRQFYQCVKCNKLRMTQPWFYLKQTVLTRLI